MGGRAEPGVDRLIEAGVLADGGAIKAARGSNGAIGSGSAGSAGTLAIVGGGAMGLATSAGSSPGKTHTFLSLS